MCNCYFLFQSSFSSLAFTTGFVKLRNLYFMTHKQKTTNVNTNISRWINLKIKSILSLMSTGKAIWIMWKKPQETRIPFNGRRTIRVHTDHKTFTKDKKLISFHLTLTLTFYTFDLDIQMMLICHSKIWPWPWPNDLDTLMWPRYGQDVSAHWK